MMKTIKELKTILIPAAFLLVLMLFKLFYNHGWKGDNVSVAADITQKGVFIQEGELQQTTEPVVLVRIAETKTDTITSGFPSLEITLEEITGKAFLQKIKQPGTRYVILSENPARATEAWIILNRLGIENLFVYSGTFPDNERFKYQFQPDTTFRLELEEED